MKIDESSIYHQINELDPAVIRAQRLQELKDLAEYRHRFLTEVAKWSAGGSKEKIAQYNADLVAFKGGRSFDGESVRFGIKPLKFIEITKPKPKMSWYRRLLAVITR